MSLKRCNCKSSESDGQRLIRECNALKSIHNENRQDAGEVMMKLLERPSFTGEGLVSLRLF